ncbi:hypothetical protein [Burkholderia multivorans]|uniref:hypothetical protein n=1 Tax=Burkholderia multivorans TaxID=87883 RepID=UPI0020B25A32|nr:hypothetical protein [Burkholderia multivorans]
MRDIYSIDAVRDPMDGSIIAPLNAWGAGTRERFWIVRHDPYTEVHHPGRETSLVLVGADGTTAAKMPLQLSADLDLYEPRLAVTDADRLAQWRPEKRERSSAVQNHAAEATDDDLQCVP